MKKIPLHDFTRDDASSIAFQVERLRQKRHYDSTKPHRHNFYEIFFFEKGGGSHELDFEVLPIEDHCLHFVSPGQVHLVQRALDSEGFVIYFSRDFYYLNLQNRDLLFDLPYLNNNTSQPIIKPGEGEMATIRELILSMEKEYEDGGSLQEALIRSYLNVLLIQCQRIFERQHPEGMLNSRAPAGPFREFRVLLENDFSKNLQVADYAEQLNITPNYLNEVCKKATGQTASELIHHRVILEAKRLLLHSELSAKEIGYFLNFDDPSYFSRFFRKKTGSQPGVFRKTVRERYGFE